MMRGRESWLFLFLNERKRTKKDGAAIRDV
jgi:hypothetical protein